MARIDMQTVLNLLDRTLEAAEKLDGAEADVPNPNNREKMRAKAQMSSDLLFAAHLAHLVEAAILNEYYVFKGMEGVPTIHT